ncbi:MAG: response regulator [Bradyrhizobium sp.]|uniref:response regulator n=1 Tax=Bradyrhizobium sp. TaxID=376 RepID=UPI001D5222CA|nr:response regulator [Bradyrhizobium sp.]MBV9562018.1 response regulator [Bradyrhizobium sp.]
MIGLPAENARQRILLIEDNPADADLTQVAFETIGGTPAEIDVLANGEEAIDYLSRHGIYHNAVPPHLVLLDLNLPRVGGLEVLAAIKSLETTRHIPVVVLTSSESSEDIVRSYQLGANCYLTKPFGLGAYREMARRLYEFWLELVKLPPGGDDRRETGPAMQ